VVSPFSVLRCRLVQACGKKTHVESILNLTGSFSLSPSNLLMLNGTLAKALVADSEQHMFPFRSDSGQLNAEFNHEITLAAWGDCGRAFLRGPTGSCRRALSRVGAWGRGADCECCLK
jgi:hypothetical protein